MLVPSYDHPLIWDGHASLITEIADQLPGEKKPDAIICSVGGGGLVGGVVTGCKLVGWDDVTVVAAETAGSNCFYQTMELNRTTINGTTRSAAPNVQQTWDEEHGVRLAVLSRLMSRASSLGGSSPAPGVVRMVLDRQGSTRCLCITDEQAMATALQFTDDHKILVELACSTALAAGYTAELFHRLVEVNPEQESRLVVFVVDGGFKISISELLEYEKLVGADTGRMWNVLCDGEQWFFDKE